MTKLIYSILLLLISTISFGQKTKIDSLNKKLSQEKDEFKKIAILSKLSEYCESRDLLKNSSSTLELINKLKPNIKDSSVYKETLAQEAAAYSRIGDYYGEYSYYDNKQLYNPQKTIDNFNKSISIYKQLKLWDEINEVYSSLYSQFLRTGDSYMQLQTYKDAIEFGRQHNNKTFTARYIYRLATFYAQIGDTKKAVQYAEQGIALEKTINDPKRIAKGYLLAADLFSKLSMNEKAIEFYRKSLVEYKNNKDTTDVYYVYRGIGNAYANLNNYEEANRNLKNGLSKTDTSENGFVSYIDIINELGKLDYKFKYYQSAVQYHQLALSKSERNGFPAGIAVSSHELAKNLFQLKKYSEAKKYAEKALIVKKKITSAEQIMYTEKLCFKIDSAIGDYKSALLHFTAYTQLQNKLNQDEVHRASIKEDLNKKFEQEKEKEELLKQKREAEVALELSQQRSIRNALLVGVLLLIIIASIILRNYFIKKRHGNELLIKNTEILEQKHLIEEKQHEILDSINYAKRLQHAILPPQEFVSSYLTHNFILYQPKDIVAGDFYWAEKIDDLFFIAAADSTGHGVPGAMVSIVCSNALNRAVKEFDEKETGKILDKTRELVLQTFEKSASEVKDGMDISLLCVDLKNRKVFWSGANNPLWYIQNNELKEIKADKQPIGKTDYPKPFTTHQIDFKEATTFYLFTDGLPDQFGGPKGKKFKYKQFEELLITISNKQMQEQQEIIKKEIEDWRGTLEQVDDICVIGINI